MIENITIIGNVVGEVPIRVGSHEGGSQKVFPTDGDHTSMGTSTNVKISSLSFLHSFLLVFLNFPDLSLSSCFLNFPDQYHQKIFPWEHENVEI